MKVSCFHHCSNAFAQNKQHHFQKSGQHVTIHFNVCPLCIFCICCQLIKASNLLLSMIQATVPMTFCPCNRLLILWLALGVQVFKHHAESTNKLQRSAFTIYIYILTSYNTSRTLLPASSLTPAPESTSPPYPPTAPLAACSATHPVQTPPQLHVPP